MIGFQKTFALRFLRRAFAFSDLLILLKIKMPRRMTRIKTAKSIVPRSNVAPKLYPTLPEPSLSSPTFSSAADDSFGGNPNASLITSKKSTSSMNSPRATRFSSYSRKPRVFGYLIYQVAM